MLYDTSGSVPVHLLATTRSCMASVPELAKTVQGLEGGEPRGESGFIPGFPARGAIVRFSSVHVLHMPFPTAEEIKGSET